MPQSNAGEDILVNWNCNSYQCFSGSARMMTVVGRLADTVLRTQERDILEAQVR